LGKSCIVRPFLNESIVLLFFSHRNSRSFNEPTSGQSNAQSYGTQQTQKSYPYTQYDQPSADPYSNTSGAYETTSQRRVAPQSQSQSQSQSQGFMNRAQGSGGGGGTSQTTMTQRGAIASSNTQQSTGFNPHVQPIAQGGGAQRQSSGQGYTGASGGGGVYAQTGAYAQQQANYNTVWNTPQTTVQSQGQGQGQGQGQVVGGYSQGQGQRNVGGGFRSQGNAQPSQSVAQRGGGQGQGQVNVGRGGGSGSTMQRQQDASARVGS